MPSVPLNNVATVDAYSDAATAIFPGPVDACSVIVANAAVAMQIRRVPPGFQRGTGDWSVEEIKIPGVYGLQRPRIDAVRFRSFTAGQPAQVSVTP